MKLALELVYVDVLGLTQAQAHRPSVQQGTRHCQCLCQHRTEHAVRYSLYTCYLHLTSHK